MSAVPPHAPPGPRATGPGAGVAAGLCAGLAFGLADGLVAWRIGPALPPLALLGCLAAAVLCYAGLFGAAGLALGALLGPLLSRRPPRIAFGVLLGLCLAAGLFAEAYWWTRPYVYYGVPATDPRRLAAAAGIAAGALALGLAAGLAAARLPAWAFRRARDLLVVCAAGGAVTLVLAWRASHASERGELNERNRELPNVLLFVVDALRQDVLAPYGHPRARTPNASRLAESGVVFENAFVQAPYTWTSFGSLLTGKYPRRHGLVLMDPKVRMRLAENVTLPWHLKQAERPDGGRLEDGDFAGATFMTGTLSHGSGLMHGFDWYFEAMAGHELVNLDSRWSVFRSSLLASLFKNKLTQRFDNSLVTNTAVDWLRANARKRFVGMVHLYHTHTPYDPAPEFRALYCDPGYDGPVTAFYAEHRIAIERGEYELTPADVEQIRNLYLAGVSQADRDVGLVLDELERQGVLDDTLVVLTSDHGEELSDHGLWEHNWMYQTNLRIPLILAWPNGPEWIGRGRRVDAIVESVDLLPTVCDLLGLEPPEDGGDPYRAIDGRSLAPLLQGETDAVKRFSFAENGDFVSIQDREWKLIVRARTLSEEGAWERALAGEDEPPRLFHLALDPGETRNAIADARAEAERLFAELRAWDAAMPIPRPLVDLSARDREHELLLRNLGYVDGGTGDRSVLERREEPGAGSAAEDGDARDPAAPVEDAGPR